MYDETPKVELGFQRGLPLAQNSEIPILALILILPDGTVRTRGTPCSRTVNKICRFDFVSAQSREGSHAVTRRRQNAPKMLPVTRAVALWDRAVARCPVSLFLASSLTILDSNAFLSLSYVFLHP
ncbi:hypothetical protein PIB30_039708 [Stylosanthes scabra]|uniref:Uncharacterized protein n=1 Tax=Stylosanthes scabra TaxID=79078 RepID=A0ABU6YEQ1_9FABA|nr:hypothetical protein [Stylosanthes scabra]